MWCAGHGECGSSAGAGLCRVTGPRPLKVGPSENLQGLAVNLLYSSHPHYFLKSNNYKCVMGNLL